MVRWWLVLYQATYLQKIKDIRVLSYQILVLSTVHLRAAAVFSRRVISHSLKNDDPIFGSAKNARIYWVIFVPADFLHVVINNVRTLIYCRRHLLLEFPEPCFGQTRWAMVVEFDKPVGSHSPRWVVLHCSTAPTAALAVDKIGPITTCVRVAVGARPDSTTGSGETKWYVGEFVPWHNLSIVLRRFTLEVVHPTDLFQDLDWHVVHGPHPFHTFPRELLMATSFSCCRPNSRQHTIVTELDISVVTSDYICRY